MYAIRFLNVALFALLLLAIGCHGSAQESTRGDTQTLQQQVKALDLRLRQKQAEMLRLSLADPARAADLTERIIPSSNPLAFPEEVFEDVHVPSGTPTNGLNRFARLETDIKQLSQDYQRACQQLERAGIAIPQLPVCELCKGKRTAFGPTPVPFIHPEYGISSRIENRFHVCTACQGTGVLAREKSKRAVDEPKTPTPRTRTRPTDITIKDAVESFQNNPIRADQELAGKYVSFTGTVDSIHPNAVMVHYLPPKTNDDLDILSGIIDSITYSAQCNFLPEQRNVVGSLNPGDHIVVDGWIREYSLALQVDDCLIKKSSK